MKGGAGRSWLQEPIRVRPLTDHEEPRAQADRVQRNRNGSKEKLPPHEANEARSARPPAQREPQPFPVTWESRPRAGCPSVLRLRGRRERRRPEQGLARGEQCRNLAVIPATFLLW